MAPASGVTTPSLKAVKLMQNSERTKTEGIIKSLRMALQGVNACSTDKGLWAIEIPLAVRS